MALQEVRQPVAIVLWYWRFARFGCECYEEVAMASEIVVDGEVINLPADLIKDVSCVVSLCTDSTE